MAKLGVKDFYDLEAAYQTAASSGQWEHLAAVLRDVVGGAYQSEEDAFSAAAQLLDVGYIRSADENEEFFRSFGLGMR